MNIDTFESEFPDFYVEFGYSANGQLPDSVNLPDLSSKDKETELDNFAKIVLDVANTWKYFVNLSWRSLNVGRFSCSESEYNQEIIPATVIAAAQNYIPPYTLLDA